MIMVFIIRKAVQSKWRKLLNISITRETGEFGESGRSIRLFKTKLDLIKNKINIFCVTCDPKSYM